MKFIAKLMTFVWLFSLAVGMANACVLQAGLAGGLPTAHQPRLAGVDVVGHQPSALDEQPSTPAQQTCKRFCDTEQSTVAKTGALDLSDAPPLLAASGAWRIQATAPAEAAWRNPATAPPRLALAILFLRLTL